MTAFIGLVECFFLCYFLPVLARACLKRCFEKEFLNQNAWLVLKWSFRIGFACNNVEQQLSIFDIFDLPAAISCILARNC
jgi:hypothetical protein